VQILALPIVKYCNPHLLLSRVFLLLNICGICLEQEGGWIELRNEVHHGLYTSSDIINVMKLIN
jgi:hypothetical protein